MVVVYLKFTHKADKLSRSYHYIIRRPFAVMLLVQIGIMLGTKNIYSDEVA